MEIKTREMGNHLPSLFLKSLVKRYENGMY